MAILDRKLNPPLEAAMFHWRGSAGMNRPRLHVLDVVAQRDLQETCMEISNLNRERSSACHYMVHGSGG